MIGQLLTFARKDMIKMKALDMSLFAREAYNLASSGIPENINLTCDISTQAMVIDGDVTQLQQLIMNLLNNARDAVADISQPAVHYQLEPFSADGLFKKMNPDIKAKEFACITIADNGHGIPQDLLDKIFDPFFTTKDVGKGTGLGLSMSYSVIQRHGGLIKVESEVDKGTTFRIYLPLKEQQPENIDMSKDEIIHGNGELILIVDDEENVRSTVGEVLSNIGYKILEASNGEEALISFKANRNKIDVIVTDLVMPIMSGLNFVREVRQLNENIPIIFTTAYDKEQALEDGGIHVDNCMVISKPFSFSELSQLLHETLTHG